MNNYLTKKNYSVILPHPEFSKATEHGEKQMETRNILAYWTNGITHDGAQTDICHAYT
jgi:hypothetical protein